MTSKVVSLVTTLTFLIPAMAQAQSRALDPSGLVRPNPQIVEYETHPDTATICKSPLAFDSYSLRVSVGDKEVESNIKLVDLGDGFATWKILKNKMVFALCGLVLARAAGQSSTFKVTGDADFPLRLGSAVRVEQTVIFNSKKSETFGLNYRVTDIQKSRFPNISGMLSVVETDENKGKSVNYWSADFNWFVGPDPEKFKFYPSAPLPVARMQPPARPSTLEPPRPAVASRLNPPPAYVGPEAAQAATNKESVAAAKTSNGPRVALVIGNGSYDAKFGALANPVRDAVALSQSLKQLGFDVELVADADQKALKRAVSRFGQRLATAGRSATGLFFYAGHGVQSNGVNYLVPIGAAIDTEGDVDIEAVSAASILGQMEAAGISTSIVIFDACRNMPLARASRDGSRGLARMDAPNGSFLAYSTAPGAVAADGVGAHSPFTAALLEEIGKPDQNIQTVFLNVRRSVYRQTEGKQVPWESSSLLDTFVFNRR